MNGLTVKSRKKSKDTLKIIKMKIQQPKIYDKCFMAKTVIRGKIIEKQAYLKKQEKF